MEDSLCVGTPVRVTRKNARVWLDDTGEIDHLPLGETGVITELRGNLFVVDFTETSWHGRPAKIRVSEVERV